MAEDTTGSGRTTQAEKRFRIAFSFAGEKRAFVSEVARRLADVFGEDRILYDKFHESEFARRDLGIYLPNLYHHDADLVVAVVCPAYDKKDWTGLEWIAIHDLLKKRRDSEVMLCRFEHAEANGLFSSAGFMDLDDKTPEDAAKRILERLALNEGRKKDYYIEAKPRKRSGARVPPAAVSNLPPGAGASAGSVDVTTTSPAGAAPSDGATGSEPAVTPPETEQELPAFLNKWLALIPIAAGAAGAFLGNPLATVISVVAMGIGVLFLVAVSIAARDASNPHNKAWRHVGLGVMLFALLCVATLIFLSLRPLSNVLNRWIESWGPAGTSPEQGKPPPGEPGAGTANSVPIAAAPVLKKLVTPGIPRPVFVTELARDADAEDTLIIKGARFQRDIVEPLKTPPDKTIAAGAYGYLVSDAPDTLSYVTDRRPSKILNGSDVFEVDVIDTRDSAPRGGKVTVQLEFLVAADENFLPEVPTPAADDADQIGIKWFCNPGETTSINLRDHVRDRDEDPLRLVDFRASSGAVSCAPGSLVLTFKALPSGPDFVDINYAVTDDRSDRTVPGMIRVRVPKKPFKANAIVIDNAVPGGNVPVAIVTDPDDQPSYQVSHQTPPSGKSDIQNTGPFYGRIQQNRPWELIYCPDPGSTQDDEFRYLVTDGYSGRPVGRNRVKIIYSK